MPHRCPTCGWETQTTLCDDCYFWVCCILVVAIFGIFIVPGMK